MAGSLLPEPKQQFLSDIGDPLFAGQIFTYAAGTLTPKATYQDQALTIANTNPVVANSRGEVVMYGNGSYRVILKDSFGNTIYDRDDITISDLSASNGSEMIGNGGETVAQSFNALQLADYGALRAYTGPRKSVYVTGYLASANPSGIAGNFIRDDFDTTSVDNGGTVIITSGGVRYKREESGHVLTKWFGLNDNGVISDGTSKMQAAMLAAVGGHLIVNEGKYGLSYVGWGTNGLALDVPSDITIEFEPGASFESLPHNAIIYQMMRVWDRNNVTIIRPSLNGRRDLNAAVTGEFGMGIDIRGGSNIHVISPITINTWGDGIYLGLGVGPTPVADRVTIDRPFADGCRRQGMSIVCGNVVVNDPVWQNISGTAPAAGLDIEPDSNSDELQKIVIRNPKTFNCTTGIQIQLANFAGAIPKNIDIQIINPIDNGSLVGCSVSGANTLGGTRKLTGKISIQDPQWINSGQSSFLMSEYDALGPDVFVIRPVVVDPNRTAQSSPRYGSPFSLLRDTGSAFTYAMGGLHIEEPSVIINSGSVPRLFSFQDVVNGISKVVDCHFIDPVNLFGVSDVRGNFQGSGTVSDRFGVWNYQLLGSSTIDFNYTATVIAVNASSLLTLDGVSSFVAGSPDIMIRNSANSCIVATPAGGNFVGSAVGIRLQSPAGNAGSYVRLRPLGSNIFLIMEKYGVWNLI